MITERELSPEETAIVYEKINKQRLKHFDLEREDKYLSLYYEVDGKQYRLIYTPDGDWFLDMALEGKYRNDPTVNA